MASPSYEAVPTSDEFLTRERPLHARNASAPTSAINLNEIGSEEDTVTEKGRHQPSTSLAQPDRRLLGWRAGMTGVTGLVFACLLVNTSFLIWALRSHRLASGIATLQQGSCQTSSNLNTGIHLVINLLSTGMLSGSNYCMQRLSAPTRQELDEAHKRYRWVDIGVPSLRNLRYINRWRAFGWLVLAASSLPLHLFYNSAVFAQISAADYLAFIVDPSFMNGAPFSANLHPIEYSRDSTADSNALTWLQNNRNTLQNLSAVDCIGNYSQQVQTARGHVLAVTVPTTEVSNSSFYGSYYYDSRDSDAFRWLCDGQSTVNNPCTKAQVLAERPWKLQGHAIAYCMSQPMTETCELQFSSAILIVVIVFNVIKCGTMLIILWRATNPPLVTLGDCIAAFLKDSDHTTAGMCLLDKTKVLKGQWKAAGVAEHWDPRRRLWFAAATVKRWIIGSVLSFAGIIFTVAILHGGISNPSFPVNTTIKSLWGMGFGAVNLNTLVQIGDSYNPTLVSSTLLANTPQLILSLLYFSYNSVFTCELVGREWSEFGRHRKPLRVTRPFGNQRSTYWLNLPYRYGLPLMLVAVLLHWLFSRAIFLVNIQFVNPLQAFNVNNEYFILDEDVDYRPDLITQCGWSPSAVIISIIVSTLVVVAGLLFGFRRYCTGPPLVGSCSAAIAAACHREPDEKGDMVLAPLQWGVTSVWDGVGHCTFSARDVEMPNQRNVYR